MLCWENATICRVNVIIHCFLFALSCVGFISLLIYILANDLPKTKCSLVALFEDMMDKEEHWYGEIDFIHSPKECKYYVNLFQWIGLASVGLLVPLQFLCFRFVNAYVQEKDEQFAKDTQYEAISQEDSTEDTDL